jgi:hypothetical protein
VAYPPESWPAPDRPSREPLPRLEDLPVSDRGYDPESVRAAFDSFYRHAAQLDAALRTLEAVDSFQRQAAALRADLRTLRASGWSQQSWTAPPVYASELRAPREGVPPALWRILGEIALLVAVAVGVGVAKLSWWVILLAMAGAFLVVCLIEWLAGRDEYTFARSETLPAHPVVEAPRVQETDEHDSLGWTAFEEAQEPSDAMTIIGAPSVEDAVAPVPEAEPASEPVTPPSPEPEPEPELPPAAEADDPEGPPATVQALPMVSEPEADPWESGFDDEAAQGQGQDEITEEPIAAEEASRRRFRRR